MSTYTYQEVNSMKHRIAALIAAIALSTVASAHDPSKHKGKPVEGEVVSVADDRFEIKTATGTVPVTYSSKTKFEHGTATVDKTHVTVGERVSVFGTKLPSGELVAREVIIGTAGAHSGHAPAAVTRANSTQKAKTKKVSQ
jgi:hypothetical protein